MLWWSICTDQTDMKSSILNNAWILRFLFRFGGRMVTTVPQWRPSSLWHPLSWSLGSDLTGVAGLWVLRPHVSPGVYPLSQGDSSSSSSFPGFSHTLVHRTHVLLTRTARILYACLKNENNEAKKMLTVHSPVGHVWNTEYHPAVADAEVSPPRLSLIGELRSSGG